MLSQKKLMMVSMYMLEDMLWINAVLLSFTIEVLNGRSSPRYQWWLPFANKNLMVVCCTLITRICFVLVLKITAYSLGQINNREAEFQQLEQPKLQLAIEQ